MERSASSLGGPSGSRADDGWLQRWIPLLREQVAQRCVLELGCGKGRDTALLASAGLRVVALDRSSAALAEARRALPGVTFIESDLRAPLPVEASDVGAIVASLCLHYFDGPTTLQIVERLQRCLAPDRLLICRVNSTGDVHHGATGHLELEPGYFLVDGKTKRFFGRSDLLQLFAAGWEISSLEEHTIDRYEFPKVVWELVARAR